MGGLIIRGLSQSLVICGLLHAPDCRDRRHLRLHTCSCALLTATSLVVHDAHKRCAMESNVVDVLTFLAILSGDWCLGGSPVACAWRWHRAFLVEFPLPAGVLCLRRPAFSQPFPYQAAPEPTPTDLVAAISPISAPCEPTHRRNCPALDHFSGEPSATRSWRWVIISAWRFYRVEWTLCDVRVPLDSQPLRGGSGR
jgi:hypothetical protein